MVDTTCSIAVNVSVPNLGAIAADVAGAAAQLRALRDVESFGGGVLTRDTTAAGGGVSTIRVVNQLDGRVLEERIFEVGRRGAIAEGYEQP